jgi:hypothetical protein
MCGNKHRSTERPTKAKRSSDTIISVFCQCVNSGRGYFLGIAILLANNAKIAVNEG